MERSDLSRILRIFEYCCEIESTTQRYGKTFAAYTNDKDYQKSIAFSILQIGELVGGLTPEFRKRTTKSIQWNMIKGMRNFIVHGYGDIDHNTVWESVTDDIPALREFCEKEIGSQKEMETAIGAIKEECDWEL